MSSAWNEYSDNSDNEQENIEPIISEAVKLLFLRKYSSTNIAEEELIKLFQECNYKDHEIQTKINEKLQSTRVPYVIINKPFSKSQNYDYEETVSHDKYYRNSKKSYYKKSSKQSGWDEYAYSSSDNSNYYKSSFPYKTNNKKHYRSCKVKKGTNHFVNEVNFNHHNYYQVEKEIALSDEGNIEVMDKDGEVQDMKASKTFSKVSTVSELSANNDTREKEVNPSMSANSPLSVKKSTSEIISELRPKEDNKLPNHFFDNSSNYIKKEPRLYESKLFPGVFYTKPIEPKEKKEQNWKSVFDYYAPMIQPHDLIK